MAALFINDHTATGYGNGGLSQEKFTPYNLVKLPPLFNSPATISFSSPCPSFCFLLFVVGFSAFSFAFSALVISFSLDFLTVSRNTFKKTTIIPHERMKGRQSPYSNSNSINVLIRSIAMIQMTLELYFCVAFFRIHTFILGLLGFSVLDLFFLVGLPYNFMS